MRADFYQLSAAPLERVLPRICERLLEAGGRLLVVGSGAVQDRLEEQLWGYRSDAFLPHGRSEAARAEHQPILLSAEVTAVNGARNVAIADGRWREEALAFDRLFYFFDESSIEEARSSWRSLKDRDGVERRYWKQDGNGRWIEGP